MMYPEKKQKIIMKGISLDSCNKDYKLPNGFIYGKPYFLFFFIFYEPPPLTNNSGVTFLFPHPFTLNLNQLK
jgi:hypothetical protein